MVVGQGAADPGIARLGECGGALPLLAMLATPLKEVRAPFRKDAVLQYFSNLPTHLRRHLVEPLSERFAALGDQNSVRIILDSVGRVSPDDDPNFVMASAKGSTMGKVPQETEVALEDLATSLRPEAAEALLININDRLAREERVPQDLIDTAEILSFEQGGSAEGQLLKAAQIAALFENGKFYSGFAELIEGERKEQITPSQAADAWKSGFRKSLKNASDASFARLLFEPTFSTGLEWVGADQLTEIAERLLTLGFVDRSKAILKKADAVSNDYLAARLAKAEQDLDVAIALATPLRALEAQELLAETLATAGRHAEASAVYAQLENPSRQLEEAWRAGEWDLVAERDETTKRAAARAMADLSSDIDQALDPQVTPTLASSAGLVGESETLRATIDALLSEVQTPTD